MTFCPFWYLHRGRKEFLRKEKDLEVLQEGRNIQRKEGELGISKGSKKDPEVLKKGRKIFKFAFQGKFLAYDRIVTEIL